MTRTKKTSTTLAKDVILHLIRSIKEDCKNAACVTCDFEPIENPCWHMAALTKANYDMKDVSHTERLEIQYGQVANMSYCRFENTVSDLADCNDNMDSRDLGEEESKARRKLIKLCVEIALDYGDEVSNPVQEVDED